MKIPQELAEKISEANPEWLWNQFNLLQDTLNDYQKQYNLIRYGINITTFEIYDLWRPESKALRVHPKRQAISIHGKLYKLTDYWTEEQDRINLMRKILNENLSEDAPIEPRQ